MEGSKTVMQGGLSAGSLFAQQATLQDPVDVSGEHYPLTQTLLSIVRLVERDDSFGACDLCNKMKIDLLLVATSTLYVWS